MTSEGWKPKVGEKVILSDEGRRQFPSYAARLGSIVGRSKKYPSLLRVRWNDTAYAQTWDVSLLAPSAPPSLAKDTET